MIIAERKPIAEIRESISPFKKVLILGCGTCVTVCFAGGEKEVAILASALRLAERKEGGDRVFSEGTVKRQCEKEFLEEVAEKIREADVVLSLACAIGIQAIVEFFPQARVRPGVNTSFLGLPVEHGIWKEVCLHCGDCVLTFTEGLCPIARCAKNLLNGPCGGSQGGRCEVSPETPCAWQLIYDRLESLGLLGNLDPIRGPKNWAASYAPGPRKIVREDLRYEVGEQSGEGS